MSLHLIKLCVGCDSVADLEDWIREKLKEKKRRRQKPEHIHTTRMVPKRGDELIDGGSLYWVVRGQIACRERILDIRPFTDKDGVGRCRIVLDGTIQNYDMCPNILVADFQPNGGPNLALGNGAGVLLGGANAVVVNPSTGLNTTQHSTGANTNVSIAGCSQDLTQVARPVITKYTYTFWNQDESSRTGSHECADSWYETYLPRFLIQGANVSTTNRFGTGVGASTLNPMTGTGPVLFTPTNNAGIGAMPLAQYSSLGTTTAYMRVESTPDPAVCFGAVQVGMLGVISHENTRLYVRCSNMIGRGTNASGVMTWTPGPADSFMK
jgi:hypothetical protein